MRIALIGCMVLSREVSSETACSENTVRTWWLKQGLHDTPDLLRKRLQEQIDLVEEEQTSLPNHRKFDVICIAYGLCSNGVVGLESRTIPLVIPRCDDCIALFLGSQKRYETIFHEKPGIYWYNPGWIENSFTPSEENYQLKYEDYIERFGEDNAEYLMEAETNWAREYQHFVYIESPIYRNPDYVAYTKRAAAYLNCEFSMEPGEMSFISKLLNGPWNEDQFLVCPPNHQVVRRFDDRKIDAAISER